MTHSVTLGGAPLSSINAKENTRNKIIQNAMAVFLNKGLFETVMDDIAEASDLTRRTLYRYFKTKEDLAYEVVILILEEWNQFQMDVYENVEGNGIGKLEQFLKALVN